jgi:hypothetical protein
MPNLSNEVCWFAHPSLGADFTLYIKECLVQVGLGYLVYGLHVLGARGVAAIWMDLGLVTELQAPPDVAGAPNT